MGTKAVFEIFTYKDQIIGMISDGFPKNLELIAYECWELAKKLRVLTKWKQEDKETIKIVLDALVKKHSNWLFLDYPNNPEWVRYSACMSIANRSLNHYEGYKECNSGFLEMKV